jgi:hypothetical protein
MVKVGLTGWKTGRSRSRASPARQAPCRLGRATRRAPRLPRHSYGPGPTASRHEPLVPLRAGILGTRAASSCLVPRRTRPELPRGPSRVPLPSAPTEVRRRTEELWRAHPFVSKTGSQPAIKAAHCPTRRPTSSSAIGASTASSPSCSFPQPCGTLATFTRIP